MFTAVRIAWAMVPALLRFFRSDYVDVNDFLGVMDNLQDIAMPRVLANPHLRAIASRPLMAPLPPVAELLAHPEGSIGHVLGTFLRAQGFDHIRVNVEDNEAGRVRAWVEQTHDLWHVVTGFGSDLPGEMGLQAFYLAQLGPPPSQMAIGALLLRNLTAEPARVQALMDAVAFGWHQGRTAEQVAGIDWHAELMTPVRELRARLGLSPATGALAAGRYHEDRAAHAA